MWHPHILVTFVALLVLSTSSVRAQKDASAANPKEDEITRQARELFNQGVSRADERQWALAADNFRRSISLRGSAVASYNLAYALGRLGKVVEAVQVLQSVIWDDDAESNVRSAARGLHDEFVQEFAWITVKLQGESNGVQLFIDGKLAHFVGFGIGVPLDPGSHQISIYRDGTRIKSSKVNLEPSESLSLTFDVPDSLHPRNVARALHNNRKELYKDSSNENKSIVDSPWFWIGTGSGVVTIMIVTVLLASSG